MQQTRTEARRPQAKRKPKLSLLEQAAALVHKEVDNLQRSAPKGTLDRLYQIATELERIEASL